DGPALLRSQDAGKRTRLAEASGVRIRRTQDREQFGQRGAIKQVLPLLERGNGPRFEPPAQVLASDLQQPRLGLQFGGHGLVQSQAAPIDPLMRPHGRSIDRRARWLKSLWQREDGVVARIRTLLAGIRPLGSIATSPRPSAFCR